MPSFDLSALTADQRPSGAWAASLLYAIARDEAAGRRPARLTEPKLDTWTRFKGRLTTADFVALLLEDAAVLHPIPFDPSTLGDSIDRGASIDPSHISDAAAEEWIRELARAPLTTPSAEYITAQARLLDLPTRMARSDLHVVKPHQRVLELPGSGGQLAHHLVSTQGDLTLQGNFVVACGSWQELTLAGVVALDLAAPRTDFATRIDPEDLRDAAHPLRQRSFDFVIGLSPDKGGHFQVEDQLAIWFSGAKVLLV